jgi:hypothetical protein
VAEIPAGDFDIEAWWRVKQAQFPALSTALRSALCHIPNSAPPERLFSIPNGDVGDDQLRAKADYKMALCSPATTAAGTEVPLPCRDAAGPSN